jgi:uncharacterized protein (TIGR00375 family)
MPFIADLHIHSKYSLATSKEMEIGSLAKWAGIKGVGMLGTGDFTHPLWLKEIRNKLAPDGYGTYEHRGTRFILTAEVSNIYFKAGRTRKVHNIIFAPSFDAAEEMNKALSPYGRLASDGRPILKLECDRMVKIASEIDPAIFFVPSHVWTPHFGVFGSKSGFDSLEECFEDQTPKIFALETGLSSDPAMNRRWSKLDGLSLISNSDSHSPLKIGREANVFKDKIGYKDLVEILKTKDNERFLYTIEFFPEEGKYHWDGHSACRAPSSPKDAIKNNNLCRVCGKPVTVGVAHRLEGLVDRPDGFVHKSSPPFKSVVGLFQIISDALKVGAGSKKVKKAYFDIIGGFGTEMEVLIYAPEEAVRAKCPADIAKGILNVRNGKLAIMPGYDGEYGKVKVL